MHAFKLIIDGEIIRPEGRECVEIVNPATWQRSINCLVRQRTISTGLLQQHSGRSLAGRRWAP